jgi:hypothetical protein
MTDNKPKTDLPDQPRPRPDSVQGARDPLPWLIRSLRKKHEGEAAGGTQTSEAREETSS